MSISAELCMINCSSSTAVKLSSSYSPATLGKFVDPGLWRLGSAQRNQ